MKAAPGVVPPAMSNMPSVRLAIDGGPGAPPPMGAAGTAPSAPMAAPGGGMGDKMAEMMGKMMTPPPIPGAAAVIPAAGSVSAPSAGCPGGNCGPGVATTPIYPSLMTLPALSPEKRAEIDALANQQIGEGMARLAEGSESLDRATKSGDSMSMQRSVGAMRAALDELEAGIAARRVLSEGKAPRNLALDWFKREMNLASPIPREEPRSLLGVRPFHLFTMVLLIAFALAMVAMYFFKMRRAAALFGRLEAVAGEPPPGSAPPLAGAPSPSSPVAPLAEKASPPGGTPATAQPAAPVPPATEPPPASDSTPGGTSTAPAPEAT